MAEHLIDDLADRDSRGVLYELVNIDAATPQEALRAMADELDRQIGTGEGLTVRWRSEPHLVFSKARGWRAWARFTVTKHGSTQPGAA